MDSPYQIIVPGRTGINRLTAKAGVFQPGSMLRIKVLELNGNRALIDFGAGRTTADIKIPVRVGEELLVRVQESVTQPRLELVASDPAASSGDKVVGLRTPTVDLDSRRIIQPDLKQLLLQFLGSDRTSGVPANLRKSIEFLLKDIIRQQGRALRMSASSEPFQIFTFSLSLAHDRQPAKLKVYYPRKQRTGSQQGFQISMLLSMDHLGDIRTDLYLLERDLSVTFFVKNQAVRSTIQQFQTDLVQVLNPFFNQTRLRMVMSKKKIHDFEQDDVQVANDRRVDLRI